MTHAEMTKKYYQQEIMVKEHERRLHGIVAELVAVKTTLNNAVRFIIRPGSPDDALRLENAIVQRGYYLEKVIDELLQPIDVSGWDKHEGGNLEIEGAEMTVKGENL